MSDLYDTHEQGEIVKSWLRENGSAIVMGLVLAFGLMFAVKQWQAWETSKHQQASAEYQVLVSLIESDNMDAAVSNYEVLKTQYAKSSYTSMAAMMMAKARVAAGQMDLAANDLQFAMANAQPAPIQVIARERLARIRLSQGDTQAAMDLLDAAPSEAGFESQFAEIRGDIHLARGEKALAVQRYQESLAVLEEGVGNRDFLIMKLEALGSVEYAGEQPDSTTDGGDR